MTNSLIRLKWFTIIIIKDFYENLGIVVYRVIKYIRNYFAKRGINDE